MAGKYRFFTGLSITSGKACVVNLHVMSETASPTLPDLRNLLPGSRHHLDRIARIEARYRRLREDPDGCSPCIQIQIRKPDPAPEEQFKDPMLMLRCQLESLLPSYALEDDRLPSVRVNFGTAQVAHAFGCTLAFPTNSLPAAHEPAIQSAAEIYTMKQPTMADGLYPRLLEWTELWFKHLPEGVRIQHPDVQSAFNTAHLIRGNDIFTDLYDEPEAVDALLDRVTDFMIELIPQLNKAIRAENGWFADWGAWWQGAARISNCTLHLVSPDVYERHIRSRDARLFSSIGGGRMHYCGTHGKTLGMMTTIPGMSAIDLDPKHHDFWALAEQLPEDVVLGTTFTGAGEPFVQRLLNGDWPKKRNLMINCFCKDLNEGREILQRLRETGPKEK